MMSSPSHTRLSSGTITRTVRIALLLGLLTYLILAVQGCAPWKRPTGAGQISDRLINFLLNQELPLGDAGSPVRSAVQRCGIWVRDQLERSPEQRFTLDAGTRSIIAEATGDRHVLSPELAPPLMDLNRFFQTNAAVDKTLFTVENVRNVLNHPRSKATVETMIARDRDETVTETGGVVTLDPSGEFLRFHPIRSDNGRWIDRLKIPESPAGFAVELRRILPDLPYLKVRAKRALMLTEDDTLPEAERAAARDDFIDLLSYRSRYSYFLEQGTQYAAIAEQGINGVYMGVFHVHPPDNPPSMEDRAGSIFRKNFVLIPVAGGVEVQYLDFTADLSAEPAVIRWRSIPD